MAITVIGTTGGQQLSTSSPETLALPTTTNAGDCLVVCVSIQSTGAVAVTGAGATWVEAIDSDATGPECVVWVGYNCAAGATSVTITYTGGYSGTYVIGQFAGVENSKSPVATSAVASSTADVNSLTTPSISYTAGQLVIAAMSVYEEGAWGTVTWSDGGTTTTLGSVNSDNRDINAQYIIPTSSGSTTATFTWPNSDTALGGIFALAPETIPATGSLSASAPLQGTSSSPIELPGQGSFPGTWNSSSRSINFLLQALPGFLPGFAAPIVIKDGSGELSTVAAGLHGTGVVQLSGNGHFSTSFSSSSSSKVVLEGSGEFRGSSSETGTGQSKLTGSGEDIHASAAMSGTAVVQLFGGSHFIGSFGSRTSSNLTLKGSGGFTGSSSETGTGQAKLTGNGGATKASAAMSGTAGPIKLGATGLHFAGSAGTSATGNLRLTAIGGEMKASAPLIGSTEEKISGSGSFAATAHISSSQPLINLHGTAALLAAVSTSGSGHVIGVFNGAGRLGASASLSATGHIKLTGNGAFAASGAEAGSGTPKVSGHGSTAASWNANVTKSTVKLTGHSSMAGSWTIEVSEPGSLALPGHGSIGAVFSRAVSSGTLKLPGQGELRSTSGLVGQGFPITIGEGGTFESDVSITATGVVVSQGHGQLVSITRLVANGLAIPPLSGSGRFQGSAGTTAAGQSLTPFNFAVQTRIMGDLTVVMEGT